MLTTAAPSAAMYGYCRGVVNPSRGAGRGKFGRAPLPLQLQVRINKLRPDERWAGTNRVISDVHAIARLGVLDARLHRPTLPLDRQVVTNSVRGCVGFAAGADLAVDVRDVPRDRSQA